MPSLFVGGPAEFIKEIKQAALENGKIIVIGEAVTPEDPYLMIDKLQPDAFILPAVESWITTGIDIAKMRPNLSVFVSGAITADTWAALAEHRIVSVPANPKKAVQVVVSSLEKLGVQKFKFEDTRLTPPQVKSAQKTVTVPTKVIMVYSAKGGAGKTTVAENMAAVLGIWAKQQEEKYGLSCRVALIDMNLDGSTGMYTWCSNTLPKTASLWEDIDISNLRWADVSTAMNYNETANVWYLAPPINPRDKEYFSQELVEKILASCKRFFHFTIIDTGVALKNRDGTIMALHEATDIVFVCDYNYKSMRLFADVYNKEVRQMLNDPTKCALVLNKVKPSWFTPKDFVEAFAKTAGDAVPVKGEIPEEPLLESREACMRCAPFVCVRPDTEFSKAITLLCRNVVGIDAAFSLDGRPQNKDRLFAAWFSRLFSKK